MYLTRRAGVFVKKLVFGDTLLPQEFTLGLQNPLQEVSVWLHGVNPPLDVTRRHAMVCAAPFVVCVGLDSGYSICNGDVSRLSLKFSTPDSSKGLLGEIRLKPTVTIPMAGIALNLFEARSSRNYCLPFGRLWAHYSLQAYSHWRRHDIIRMSLREERAAMVMFIRPHPVSLVSLSTEHGGNIFPINIMGDIGDEYFVFGLRDSKQAADLVERSGQIALSSVPLEHAALAYQLAPNHTKYSIRWERLPFSTSLSRTFNLPVPHFSQRIRELEIKGIHRIGSHRLFIARIVSDDRRQEAAEVCVVHGFYQFWRLRGRRAELATSLAADAVNKGLQPQHP